MSFSLFFCAHNDTFLERYHLPDECPLSVVIMPRCFRSLFRTDSEEQGIKEVPTVSDPVASYSLFDSTWSVPFSRSQIKGWFFVG